MLANQRFPHPEVLGTFRQFGVVGPAYKVLEPVELLNDGDWLMMVQVVESGEKVRYRYTSLMDDPRAI